MRGLVGLGGVCVAYEDPGRFGDPFAPEHLPTLVGVLFRLPRFAAHANWTVGEHSLFVHDIVAASGAHAVTRRAALLHDLPEAYTGDIVGPLKTPRIAGIDKLWHARLVESFGLEGADWDRVKRADLEALRIEAEAFVHSDFWRIAADELGVSPPPLSRSAVLALRELFTTLGGRPFPHRAHPAHRRSEGFWLFGAHLLASGYSDIRAASAAEQPGEETVLRVLESYLASETVP